LNFHGRELLERVAPWSSISMCARPFSGSASMETFFLQMPLEPALVIQRFANRDAVKPSFKALPAENCEMPRKAFKKTSWVPSAASEVSPRGIPRG